MHLRSGSQLDRPMTANPKHAIAITLHNASSPLLQLPSELRNTIYKEICGWQLIHITATDTKNVTFTHQICHATVSEEEAYEIFHNESEHPWNALGIEDRHRACGRGRQKLSLSFLRTCRQLYAEARHFPYTTNRFSFDNVAVLDGFTLALVRKGVQGSYHHLAIQSLHLRISPQSLYWRRSDWALRLRNRLRSLRHISLSVEFDGLGGLMPAPPYTSAEYEASKKWSSPSHSPRWRRSSLCRESWLHNVLGLDRLPLETARVVISDIAAERAELVMRARAYCNWTCRWTLAEKQEWAQYVEGKLLRRTVEGEDEGLGVVLS
ncbi:hypothetical protein N7G274_000088 [Stereocaulon virgatum]|uniref:DUF7730 domain-containing protein n=1 Tax=Stereocaulon virgatum TaxID=373712 RepID=A0ABR4AR42_9LECA